MTPNSDGATTGSYTLKTPFTPKDLNNVKKKLVVNEEDIVREEAQLEEASSPIKFKIKLFDKLNG